MEATFEEKALKIGHFSLHFCLLFRILTVWLQPSTTMLLVVPSYHAMYRVFTVWRKGGVLAKKMNAKMTGYFYRTRYPYWENGQIFMARSRFELFLEPGCIIWTLRQLLVHLRRLVVVNVASNSDDKSLSTVPFSCYHEILVQSSFKVTPFQHASMRNANTSVFHWLGDV